MVLEVVDNEAARGEVVALEEGEAAKHLLTQTIPAVAAVRTTTAAVIIIMVVMAHSSSLGRAHAGERRR